MAGKWIKNNSKLLYVLLLLSYAVGLCFLVYSYKFNDIVVSSIIIEIANIIFLTFFCWYFYKQNITRIELLGIVVGIFAVGILEFA